MENPEWKNFSCQKCTETYPYIKSMVTDGAEDVISLICNHKDKKLNTKRKSRLYLINCKHCIKRSVGIRLNTSIICMSCKYINKDVFVEEK